MKGINIEIATNELQQELIKLGQRCDVDLEHVPFQSFTISAPPEPVIIDEPIQQFIDDKVMEMYLFLDEKELEVYKEAVTRAVIGRLKNAAKELTIKVEINKNNIYMENVGNYYANITMSKTKFNCEDRTIKANMNIHTFNEDDPESELNEVITNLLWFVFGILAFMTTTKEKVTPTLKIGDNKPKKKKSSKNKSSSKKRQVNYIYNYRIDNNAFDNAKPKSKKQSEKRAYSLASWYRRGHWRNYQSGKKVWIEPQFVHPQNVKDSVKNATYRITKFKR